MGGQTANRFATLIAGPTASGKSALAQRLATERGGVVVNADSMQVYKELRILTARPNAAEEAAFPHRLFGFRAAAEPYSVAEWLKDVSPLIETARAGGRPLVITGGTGLYFKALLEGLSPVPDIPDEIRARWRSEADALGSAGLHRLLATRDAQMAARLAPTDPQRIVRALEVLDATGRSLLHWQAVPGKGLIAGDEAELLYIAPPREALYARCDARLGAMVAQGGLDELAHLASLGLDPALPLMRAVGVRPLLAHLQGLIDLDAAMTDARTETRRYAKRQLTWAKRNMMSWNWISTQ